MKTIENLSSGSQIRRLRELGEAALTYYDLGNARLSLLTRGDSSVFQVVASPIIRKVLPKVEQGEEESLPEEGVEGEEEEELLAESVVEVREEVTYVERSVRSRYALRLYSDTSQSLALIVSELQWLQALRRDTGLLVPEPVLSRNGELLTEVKVEGIPEAIRCVLFRWVEGRFVDMGMVPAHMERVGTLMARLHLHARTFSPPAGFTRPRWNSTWIFGERSITNPAFNESSSSLSPHAQTILQASEQKIEGELQDLSQDSENYGLIHYDLQHTNYLFYKDEARAIGFKDCCYGYYLLDMAVTLSDLLGRENEPALREAFFRGYSSLRALPPQYEERLQAFTALRLIKRANHLIRTTDALAPQWLHYTADWLEKFLDRSA